MNLKPSSVTTTLSANPRHTNKWRTFSDKPEEDVESTTVHAISLTTSPKVITHPEAQGDKNNCAVFKFHFRPTFMAGRVQGAKRVSFGFITWRSKRRSGKQKLLSGAEWNGYIYWNTLEFKTQNSIHLSVCSSLAFQFSPPAAAAANSDRRPGKKRKPENRSSGAEETAWSFWSTGKIKKHFKMSQMLISPRQIGLPRHWLGAEAAWVEFACSPFVCLASLQLLWPHPQSPQPKAQRHAH